MEPNPIAEKNRASWEDYSDKYLAYNHSAQRLEPIHTNPAKAFHSITWQLLNKYIPDFSNLHICVPSRGDNHAVFAFALLGAQVTSCDISEKQLKGAAAVAKAWRLEERIRFCKADTMTLAELGDNTFDLVYTSNGVHVWLNDLPAMYHNIFRILKPGGFSILYEIHPFQRPFGPNLAVKQPYDHVGPHEDEFNITFSWRIQDFINAIAGSGLHLLEMAEMFDEKDYDAPFFIKNEDILNGVRATREEVDRMYDWRTNPEMALPQWMCMVNRKLS